MHAADQDLISSTCDVISDSSFNCNAAPNSVRPRPRRSQCCTVSGRVTSMIVGTCVACSEQLRSIRLLACTAYNARCTHTTTPQSHQDIRFDEGLDLGGLVDSTSKTMLKHDWTAQRPESIDQMLAARSVAGGSTYSGYISRRINRLINLPSVD